jgi:hypothetical protein
MSGNFAVSTYLKFLFPRDFVWVNPILSHLDFPFPICLGWIIFIGHDQQSVAINSKTKNQIKFTLQAILPKNKMVKMSIYPINTFTLIEDVTIEVTIEDIKAHLPISIAYNKAKPADLDSNIII